MNHIVEEMNALCHYGVARRSGRYPWGSGDDPYQRGRDLIGRIEQLKKDGWTETPENIQKEFGMTTTQYRAQKALARSDRRMLQVETAKRLREKECLGDTEIGRRMGVRESTVRGWFNEKAEANMKQARATADFLKKQVDERGMIDVGVGAERELNISKEKLKQALTVLEMDGYPVYSGGIPNVTNPGKQINQTVLCPPGTKHSEIFDHSKVTSLKEYISRDGGETYEKKFNYPESMDSKRLMIRYNEEGGLQKDGIVELRRGVPDLSLGESRYSQVRILVDGTHYIKGMAVYSDDMPAGVDVVFNTNKKVGTDPKKVLKEIKKDPDNPFGSAIKDAELGGQYWYDPKTGDRVSASHPNAKLGLINKRADEGDWSEWKDALPSQFLSKQPIQLAKQQLGLAKADKLDEFNDICSLTNPTVKKHFLRDFADNCDSAAVHLQAAALPGQKYHVIIPINSLKEGEIYAPGYDTGTQLALIRYPHGGTFEIPILTVNNKHAAAKKLLGTDIRDAVGIHSKVAEQLSGADFDGDTVMCIPTNNGKVKIRNRQPLKELEGFDSKSYQYDTDPVVDENGITHYYRNGKEFKVMRNTGKEMGVISNLITDMTLYGGATDAELARAVKHSMVVIDAEKHKLDYRQSEIDNDIDGLKRKYQAKVDVDGNITYGGASTIISRSKGEYSVLKRQGSPLINQKGKDWYDPDRPEGALIYKTAEDKNLLRPIVKTNKRTGIRTYTTVDGQKIKFDPEDEEARSRYSPVKKVDPETNEVTYVSRSGEFTYQLEARQQKSTRMAETDDAHSLVSTARHPMELEYANYANSMKALANKARIEMVNTGKIPYSAAAKEVYKDEVNSLNSKLNTALLNAPRERQAHRMANAEVNAKLEGGQISKKDVKKTSQRALTKYRSEVGGVSRRDRSIEITDREWEAIQAGAVSENTLLKILANADADSLRQRAMPKSTGAISSSQAARIKSYAAKDVPIGEIAKKLGLSTSTVSKYLKGVN